MYKNAQWRLPLLFLGALIHWTPMAYAQSSLYHGASRAIVYDPAIDDCTDNTKILCAREHVHPVAAKNFEVVYNDELSYVPPIEARTWDLEEEPEAHCDYGEHATCTVPTPDTLILLYYCGSNEADCEHGGTLVAIDDNGHTATADPLDSEIEYTPCLPSSPTCYGWYRMVIATASTGHDGLTHAELIHSGNVHETTDEPGHSEKLFFGGWWIEGVTVSAGDTLLVGKDPVDSKVLDDQARGEPGHPETWDVKASRGMPGAFDWHDTQMYALTTTSKSCVATTSAPCGDAGFANDVEYGGATLALTRMGVTTGFTGNILIAATADHASHPEYRCPTSLCGDLLNVDCVAGDGTVTSCPPQCDDGSGTNDVDCFDDQPLLKVNARFMHLRDGQDDDDLDGLPAELEERLGTCDSVDTPRGYGVGVRGYSCREYRDIINDTVENESRPLSPYPRTDLINSTDNDPQIDCASGTGIGGSFAVSDICWSSTDSDHDGIRDDVEAWGGAIDCPQEPAPPWYDGGGEGHDTCSWHGPADAPACSGWCITEALSALDDPDPAVYDIFVQADAFACKAANANDTEHCWGPVGAQSTHHSANAGEDDGWNPADWHLHQRLVHDHEVRHLKIFAESFGSASYLCWDGREPVSLGANKRWSCRDELSAPINVATASVLDDLDRPYLSRLHIVRGAIHDRADDHFHNELLFGGAPMARSYAPRGWDAGLRLGRIGRFVLLAHHPGGQAIKQEALEGVVNDDGTSIGAVVGNERTVMFGDHAKETKDLVHELGHTLSLAHPHDNLGAGYCNSTSPGPCADAGQANACLSTTFTCEGGAWIHPMNTSVMGYYSWFGEKRDVAPPTNTTMRKNDQLDVCDALKPEFSKGLNVAVDESTLYEDLSDTNLDPQGTGYPYWRQQVTARALFCTIDPNWPGECDTLRSFGYLKQTPTGSSELDDEAYGPYCDTTTKKCYVNWDRDDDLVPSSGAVAANLSYRRLQDAGALAMCTAEEHRDLDEWLKMMALGKRGLLQPHDETQLRFNTLYASTFNDARIDNVAGWDKLADVTDPAKALIPVLASGTSFAREELAVNLCANDAECALTGAMLPNNVVPTCAFDTCTSSNECIAPSEGCSSGRCGCTDGDDCRSGRCQADGTCWTARGGCTCTRDGHCREVDDDPWVEAQDGVRIASLNIPDDEDLDPDDEGLCKDYDSTNQFIDDTCRVFSYQSTLAPLYDGSQTGEVSNSHRPYLDHIELDGSAELRLKAIAAGSPLATIAGDRDSYEFWFDARFDEFPGGQTVQVVIDSDALVVTYHQGTGGAGEVEVEGPGGLTLSWPTPDAGAPIYPGHWHRYRIGYSKDDGFFLEVIPWSMFRGRYVNAEWNNAGHTETSAPNDVPLPGDIVFGGPQAGTTDRMVGAFDNIVVRNYVEDWP